MRYTSFDEVVRMVIKCDMAAELAKCDMKSVLQILPVHPQDFVGISFSEILLH